MARARDRRDLGVERTDRGDQHRRQFHDDDRRHAARLAFARRARRRRARLQSLHAVVSVLRRRDRRRRADRGEPGGRRFRRRVGFAARVPSGAPQRFRPRAARLGDPMERQGRSPGDRRAAGPRGAGRALYARPAMGAGARASLFRRPVRVRSAQPDRADPDRRARRGRLQRDRELCADLRPFRRAGLGCIRFGRRHEPVAVRHAARARRVFPRRSDCAAIGCSSAFGGRMAKPSRACGASACRSARRSRRKSRSSQRRGWRWA